MTSPHLKEDALSSTHAAWEQYRVWASETEKGEPRPGAPPPAAPPPATLHLTAQPTK